MALKVEKYDPSPARQTLVGMITAKAVLGPIASRWVEPGLFDSKWMNLLGGWAVEHYRTYGKAPKAAIEHYFTTWAETGDKETADMIGALLVSLSDEARHLKDSFAPDHVLDIAGRYFEKVHIQRLIDRAAAHLQIGEVEKARAAIDKSRKVEIGLGAGIDVMSADAEFEEAIEHAHEKVVEYPGALGDFFGDSFYRGGFVAFWGKQKIGKSYILQDVVWQALDQGRRVAYFECGDSTKEELFERFACRICNRPKDAEKYYEPISLETFENTHRPPTVGQDTKETTRPLTAEEERRAREKFKERIGDAFKVSIHPTSSVSVSGIETILDGWGRDGWIPDIIAVDYADILAPMDRRLDKRDQVNETWISLRRLSQSRHSLVLTLSQIKAEGFEGQWLLDRTSFSEDNRKLSHATTIFGINQKDAEKTLGVYRLNYIEGRRLKQFNEKKYVTVAGCLATCRPFVLSSF